MADSSITDDARKAMEHQVRELRDQITLIDKSLTKHGFDIEDVRDHAENLFHGAQKNARRAARHVQKKTDVVAKAAQRARLATSTALTIVSTIAPASRLPSILGVGRPPAD
ncbi:hypothetical protein [Pelagibacterium lentulum]|uniref:Uncharacterized protein n=1 Tax=Pelagibacterium lentulum TaxID=2029865 RepID=A0A916RKX2_9HYPH|nr:hypothetical protein [Pelagibacterium lentulum]GGA60233.1 hypothetical protein GCM10011499_33080 [Pelagibacterium lentulum]